MTMAMPIPPPRSWATFPPRAGVLAGRLDRAVAHDLRRTTATYLCHLIWQWTAQAEPDGMDVNELHRTGDRVA